MELNTNFITMKFQRNDVPPPSNVITLERGGEEIRQIPQEHVRAFKTVFREQSLIDIYV